MDVTIYQINGRIFRLSNVHTIMEDEEKNIIHVRMIEGTFYTYSNFRSDLIAQIKIGGKHEYKKR